MLPRVEDVEPLSGPYEILEMRDGEQLQIRPERWEFGSMRIEPRDGRPPKTILAIRLHVAESAKPTLPHYWDVTGQHLVAGLLGYLEAAGESFPTFTVTKRGGGPRGRYTLVVTPAGA